jgi:hypothetical protein
MVTVRGWVISAIEGIGLAPGLGKSGDQPCPVRSVSLTSGGLLGRS